MTPEAVVMREQFRLVTVALGDARRVVEVGCGHGTLAAMLSVEGREVTAGSRRPAGPRRVRPRCARRRLRPLVLRCTGTAHEHHYGPPLHPGAAMIAAVEARFAGTRVERGPYLYRYICRGLDGPHAGTLAETVLALEWRRITSGLLPAIGLALTAAPLARHRIER